MGKKILGNMIWRFAERTGAQGVAFVVSLVLARLLEPEAYGTISLVTVFTAILNVFIDSGLGSALVQKKDADDLDFSTVFYFNVTACSIMYLGMYMASPLIARFYNNESLIPVIRVLSLTLVISGVKNIQQAYVSKTMQFKRFFFATLGGTLGAGALGIFLAYKGFGVWALVAQQLFNATVGTCILWVTVKWRPKAMFSVSRLRKLLSYGWKILASALLETLYNNIRSLIIGKVYSTSDLAFYNRGKHFPDMVVQNVNQSIDSVIFPVISKRQDNLAEVKRLTRRAIKTSSYIMWPILMGLAGCSDTLISLLLTDKWLPSVPYMQIFCVVCAFWPIHTANLNAIKALGRSDLFLKLEIKKKLIGLVLLIITMKYGVLAIAYSMLVSTVTSMLINASPNRTLLGYSFKEQIKDILPSVIIAVFMGVMVNFMTYLSLPKVLLLVLQVVAGILIYIGLSALFKLEEFNHVVNRIREVISQKRSKNTQN